MCSDIVKYKICILLKNSALNMIKIKFFTLVYSKNLFIFAALKHGYYAKHGT